MDPTGQDIRFMEMKDAISKLNNKVESLTRSFEETKAREAEQAGLPEDKEFVKNIPPADPVIIFQDFVWG